MKLPYSKEQIEAARAEIASLEEKLKVAHQTLQQMSQANHTAEREEETRKAKKLTPAGAEVLRQLLIDDARLLQTESFRTYKTRYFVSATNLKTVYYRASIVDRLILAGYIRRTKDERWRGSAYVISDSGREALKAFKS